MSVQLDVVIAALLLTSLYRSVESLEVVVAARAALYSWLRHVDTEQRSTMREAVDSRQRL